MPRRLFFSSVALLVLAAAFVPVGAMVVDTFMAKRGIDFDAYTLFLHSFSLQESFTNSLLLSLGVAFCTTLLGVVLGLVLGKTSLPFASLFLTLLVIPLLIPPYILAYGWFELLGRSGFFGEVLFGFWGVFWVLFSIYLPIPTLLTILFLKEIDPRLEEAGRLVSGWGGVLKEITLPLMFPAIVLSFMLVFILSFGEYSVANFLRYPVFALESFTAFSAFYDFKTATVLAMPMLLVALVVLWVEQIFVRRNLFRFTSFYQIEKISLERRYQHLFLVLLSLFVGIVVLLPLATLLVKAAHWTSFQEAWHKGYAPMLRSLYYGGVGASMLVVFGFVSAYAIQKRVFKWWRFYDAALLFMFTLSSVVIAIALILFWNRPSTNFIYTSSLLILFGYLGKYLLLPTKIVQTKLSQISSSLIEAAQIAGANGWQVLRFILLPLSKEALLAGWVIGFIFLLRENSMTMLLYPPGAEPLSVYIVTQMANGKEEVIAGLCVMMLFVTLLPFALWILIQGGRGGCS